MATIKCGLIVLLCSGYFSFVMGINYNKPIIHHNRFTNPEEIVVDSSNNLTLLCEGTNEVIWKFPNNTIKNQIHSSVHVDTRESNKLYKYVARLTLVNASYADTGYFVCHDVDHDPKKNDGYSNQVYVYVRDENQLFVPQNENNIITIKSIQNNNVTIPCLPTSPDVQVSLLDQSTNEEIKYISYDPRNGFIIEIKAVTDSGLFMCVYKKEDIEDEQFVHITVYQPTTYIPKPYIESEHKGYVTVGDDIVLNCITQADLDVFFEVKWEIPDSNNETGRITINNTHLPLTDSKIQSSILKIQSVGLNDGGDYMCIAKDHFGTFNNETQKIIVKSKGFSFINLTEDSNEHNINVSAGTEHVQWSINVHAYPKVYITWYDKNKKEITNTSDKFYTVFKDSVTLLKISHVTLEDAGVYQLVAFNDFQTKYLNLSLIVRDKPTVHISSENYHMQGQTSLVICSVLGYPLPSVQWAFKPCEDSTCDFSIIPASQYTINNSTDMKVESELLISANTTGYLKCYAKNIEGDDSNTIGFYVTDVDQGFDLWGLENGAKVAVGDSIKLYCAASLYNYTEDISWSKDGILLMTNDKYIIDHIHTNFSHKVTLGVRETTYNDSGTYICHARGEYAIETREVEIKITAPAKPEIIESNMNSTELKVEMGRKLNMYCLVDGNPKPTVVWTKNKRDWSTGINDSRVILTDDNQNLLINFFTAQDEGVYSCRVSNRLGAVEKSMTVALKNKKTEHTGNIVLIVIIFILIIFFIVISIVLLLKIRKEKRLQRELKEMGLANFEKGATENLNPELRVDDQAELLPYDKKWEFPREKLKLGKQLGSGAFGVVMKAEAYGICDGEASTTVAVKMVKRNTEFIYIKALVSELKIMVHLGKHLNVVNLLGACTKNVAKRELLVIVEYCQYGNLHNYLYRHRDNFINQIDPKTGFIDHSIGADILERTFSVGSQSQCKLKYAALSFLNSDKPSPACGGVDYRANPNPSTSNPKSSCTPGSGEESLLMSNNSLQPEWRSNYRGDYKENVKPISTNDLLCWAFQVARGMDYLASRKVLHGDLAARNILLAENNIVKICDFGLAKSMYKTDNYKKKGDGPLPLKWMAIESIRDRVFSTQSDIWSYGIVLWEFFSLAQMPYAGMEADERFYHKLMDGYRMECPEYATKELHQIMSDCWNEKPVKRPTFTQLADDLGNMIQESVRNHYVDLNNPYLTMNTEVLQTGHSDYLSMLSPPDYGNLSSPHHYVNDMIPISENTGESSGYLLMKSPIDIFSPREPKDTMFDFDVNKKQKVNDDLALGIELEPMLKTGNNVDSPSAAGTPVSPVATSFSNPNYKSKIDPTLESKELIKTTDNYVNMPKNKIIVNSTDKNDTDSFSNPSYVQMHNNNSDNSKVEKNYINNQSRDWERPFV